MLKSKELHARIDNEEILRGVNLDLKAGEVHTIKGPNGSGKSTLTSVLIGGDGDGDEVSSSVQYDGQDLLARSPEERAAAGVFLAFQHPVEIPGVGKMYFMRTALNSLRRQRGRDELDELDPVDFLSLAQERMKLVEMDQTFMSRSVNEGFSGGGKKRNDILQVAILEPNSRSSKRWTPAWTSMRCESQRTA